MISSLSGRGLPSHRQTAVVWWWSVWEPSQPGWRPHYWGQGRPWLRLNTSKCTLLVAARVRGPRSLSSSLTLSCAILVLSSDGSFTRLFNNRYRLVSCGADCQRTGQQSSWITEVGHDSRQAQFDLLIRWLYLLTLWFKTRQADHLFSYPQTTVTTTVEDPWGKIVMMSKTTITLRIHIVVS